MPIQGRGKKEERKRGERRGNHGRRFNAFSRASQVDSGESSRDTAKAEQLFFRMSGNIR